MAKRLFLILFSFGMIGVISLLFIDYQALISIAPERVRPDTPTITTSLKLLSLIQPGLILALAVFVGVALAHRVGLSAPFAEALAGRGDIRSALKRQTLAGLIGGLAGGASVVFVSLLFRPFLSSETLDRIDKLGKLLPMPTRLLYGGITEEVLLRWGFMTLLVWLAWRLLQRKRPGPTRVSFISAILLSSVIFGIGHLPLAFFLIPHVTLALVLYVIIVNSVFGLIAGYLYWKKGLEAAVLAHMLAHFIIVFGSA